jgi:hypothetical protein
MYGEEQQQQQQQQHQRGKVSFSNIVYLNHTYSSDEYDRTKYKNIQSSTSSYIGNNIYPSWNISDGAWADSFLGIGLPYNS